MLCSFHCNDTGRFSVRNKHAHTMNRTVNHVKCTEPSRYGDNVHLQSVRDLQFSKEVLHVGISPAQPGEPSFQQGL
jgi:hypothetical protein